MYASRDFLLSSAQSVKYPHADNQNTRFTVEQIQDVMAVARPFQRAGLFMDIEHRNSLTHPTANKQGFMLVNYMPQMHEGVPRLAFMVEKTLHEEGPAEYLMHFNTHKMGYLQTTRFESSNFPVILSRLQGCIEEHLGAPQQALTLIHS